MRRIAAGENKAKYDFSDPDYDKVRCHLDYFNRLSETAVIYFGHFRPEARLKRKYTKQLKPHSKLNPRRKKKRITKENLMKPVRKFCF